MNAFAAVVTFFVKYTQFRGRACRSEFWNVFLIYNLFWLVALAIDAAVIGMDIGPYLEYVWEMQGDVLGNVEFVYGLVTLVPMVSLHVRRLHDIGKSGWWLLLSLSIVGLVPILVWAAKRGQQGANVYGADPLDAKGPSIPPFEAH